MGKKCNRKPGWLYRPTPPRPFPFCQEFIKAKGVRMIVLFEGPEFAGARAAEPLPSPQASVPADVCPPTLPAPACTPQARRA